MIPSDRSAGVPTSATNDSLLPPQPPADRMLLRALGPGAAIAVVVGNVIGSGIFLKPGTIAAECGDFKLIIATWIFGGFLCILGALSFAELGAMLPQAGGEYVYLREAYGKLTAFLFGWSEFLFNRPASIGALSVAFTASFAKVIDWQLAPTAQSLLAIASIGIITWVNVLGVVWGARVQTVTTIIKGGFVAFVAVLPFVMLASSSSAFDPQNYATTVTPKSPSIPAQLAVVLLAVMWAYNGWHGITPIAEEVRDPQRNIPLALFGGIGILIVLYVSANVAYHGVLSMEEVAAAGNTAAGNAAEKTVRTLLGDVGGKLMSIGIMCSTFGAISANLLISPRVPFAMGRDGLLFRSLGWVHVNYRSPSTAIIVEGAMAGVFVLVGGILVHSVASLQGKNVFNLLTDFVIFGASIFYALAVLAVMVLRRRRPAWPRPYRTWGYPITPILFLIVYVWFLSRVYIQEPFAANAGLVLIATGLPVYYGWQAYSRATARTEAVTG